MCVEGLGPGLPDASMLIWNIFMRLVGILASLKFAHFISSYATIIEPNIRKK